jgi:RecA-family ATPase
VTENILTQFNAKVQLVSVSNEDWGMTEQEAKHMNNGFFNLNDIPDKTWLVDGLIGEQEIGIFYGKSGVGKTFIVLDLLLSCADGQPFAKRFSVSRPLTVAIAAGEGGLALKKHLTKGKSYLLERK